ncbi:hypothetical protein L486_01752 [Kwoniella mangroviensis CBS 10435]|uniref:Uncharacterized protein n=1 Tax=Kwoniella mangroviensis CBS 10435 TaxID=1331196 RepID=A0A1B9J2R9_9TREE|nr:hypothetical protein L486_01752 [Kwoniella mangroviensis CBS 10435]
MVIAAGVRWARKSHEKKKKEKEQQGQIHNLQTQQPHQEQDTNRMLKKDKDTLNVQDSSKLDSTHLNNQKNR